MKIFGTYIAQYVSIHPTCSRWQIAWLSIHRRKKPRHRGDLLPQACPRWLMISRYLELDSAILAAAHSETQALSQHVALTWMAERSFHISRCVLWRRDRREGILQLMVLLSTDSRRTKSSQDRRQTWLLILTTIFRFFCTLNFHPQKWVTLTTSEFSVLVKSLLLC